MQISILGAGAWGTAVAASLATRHDCLLWMRDKNLCASMTAHHQNTQYLPNYSLPTELSYTDDLPRALEHAQTGLLVVATSLAGLRPLLEQIKLIQQPSALICLCKGVEENTYLLPHQITQQVLEHQVAMGVLTGPSFAQEVVQNKPCALTLATPFTHLQSKAIQAFHTKTMRIYASDDLIGAEMGGAIKNVLAIAVGISDGLQLGHNARAALMTRGLAEMIRLGTKLGGRSETLMGLSGVGDLILTCTGDLSRNRRVGLELTRGQNLQQITTTLGHVAEGVRCAQAIDQLAKQHQVEMPICHTVARILFEAFPLQEAITELMTRPVH